MILTVVYLCFQAEKFDGLVHSFMERLTEAERVLKYGVIPEEEEGLRAFHKQHKVSKVCFFFTLLICFSASQRSGSSAKQHISRDKDSLSSQGCSAGWI